MSLLDQDSNDKRALRALLNAVIADIKKHGPYHFDGFYGPWAAQESEAAERLAAKKNWTKGECELIRLLGWRLRMIEEGKHKKLTTGPRGIV